MKEKDKKVLELIASDKYNKINYSSLSRETNIPVSSIVDIVSRLKQEFVFGVSIRRYCMACNSLFVVGKDSLGDVFCPECLRGDAEFLDNKNGA